VPTPAVMSAHGQRYRLYRALSSVLRLENGLGTMSNVEAVALRMPSRMADTCGISERRADSPADTMQT
jgi:hypothetical protein